MKYKVLWMRVAQIDLQAIYDYILIENPSQAVKVFKQIKSATQKLQELPNSGRIVPEFEKQNLYGVRELIVKHWRILYKVVGKQVHIVAVLDSRRNLLDVLTKRFMKMP